MSFSFTPTIQLIERLESYQLAEHLIINNNKNIH